MNLDIRLPHNFSLEKIILGNILMYPKILEEVRKVISKEDFFSQRNQNIFSAIERMKNLKQPVDLVLLHNFLSQNGDLRNCGGSYYVVSIVDGVHKSSVKNMEHYCRKLKELTLMREIVKECYRTIKNFNNNRAGEPNGVFIELRQRIDEFLKYENNKKVSKEGQNAKNKKGKKFSKQKDENFARIKDTKITYG